MVETADNFSLTEFEIRVVLDRVHNQLLDEASPIPGEASDDPGGPALNVQNQVYILSHERKSAYGHWSNPYIYMQTDRGD